MRMYSERETATCKRRRLFSACHQRNRSPTSIDRRPHNGIFSQSSPASILPSNTHTHMRACTPPPRPSRMLLHTYDRNGRENCMQRIVAARLIAVAAADDFHVGWTVFSDSVRRLWYMSRRHTALYCASMYGVSPACAASVCAAAAAAVTLHCSAFAVCGRYVGRRITHCPSRSSPFSWYMYTGVIVCVQHTLFAVT